MLLHKKYGLTTFSYFSQGMPAWERDYALSNWVDGTTLVCTTAFSTGISHVGVRLVTHLCLAQSVESFWQTSGRVARVEGEVGLVLVLLGLPFVLERLRMAQDSARYSSALQLLGVLTHPGCLRRSILAFLGGDGGQPCSGCDVTEPPALPCRARWVGCEMDGCLCRAIWRLALRFGTGLLRMGSCRHWPTR